jgi:PDZ domain/Peptidase family S41
MRLKCLLTMASLMLFANLSASPIASSLLKKRVLADLDCIQHMFEVKYAPQFWKGEFAGWELSDAMQTARHKISANSTVSLRDCQIIVRDFFNSTRDYHVGVRFFSTESASLPFLVKGAQGRYFVSFVDREQLSVREFPFEEGDEILTFGNQPIHNVVNELRIREFGDNTFETDQSLAELALTHRRGDLGQIVPQGNVTITGIKKRTSRVLYATLKWHHVPEKIRDFSRLGVALESFNLTYQQKDPQDVQSVQELLANSHFFQKFMVSHLWDKSYVGAFNEMNKHSLGARTSFIPPLGRKIWKSNTEDVFDAYIFETDTGSNIGYIRLPHYIGDEEEVEEFGLIMNLFQKRTDALVIDQVNNPGGSVFYLYALAATLTDKPLNTPKHHLAMTQEEAYIATQLLHLLEKVVCDESARQTLGENLGGYPVDYQFVKLMRKFCNFLVQQWEKGKFISDLTHLFGVDDILPHPQYRYTKPIILLTNSLDFSGGDFFPAILQDNKRAVILGTRTAGAGGYVLSTSYPNHSGIKSFVMTGSLARRFNSQPLENLGVIPDIPYELSVTDLQENYKDYIKVIQDTVESLL